MQIPKGKGNRSRRFEERYTKLINDVRESRLRERVEEAIKRVEAGESFSFVASETDVPSCVIKNICIKRGISSEYYNSKQREQAQLNKQKGETNEQTQ